MRDPLAQVNAELTILLIDLEALRDAELPGWEDRLQECIEAARRIAGAVRSIQREGH